MTVKELMEKLKGCPPDALVVKLEFGAKGYFDNVTFTKVKMDYGCEWPSSREFQPGNDIDGVLIC